MERLRNSVLFTAVLFCIMACDISTPYHHFEAVADEGWDKEDTLAFSIDTLRQTGTYAISIDVRTSELYPYRNLSLLAEETVVKRQGKKVSRCFPVALEPRNEDGSFKGKGLGQHVISIPLTHQYLFKGDSIHFKVHHTMRRLLLPGITAIGIKLEK